MTTLAEAVGGARRIIGGPFGSNLTQADYTDSGIPVIRGSNMGFDGRWIGGSFVYVSPEKVSHDLENNIAFPGDIIVTQRGTLGQVSIIPAHLPYERYVISQSQMAISIPDNHANTLFIYYWLRSNMFNDYVAMSTIQTGVPHINLRILRSAPLVCPKPSDQHAIVSVLSALDDKIELNHEMNETLEAMARAIFRDWFIDFGPTRAKMAGSKPYLAPEIWKLFPDSLDDEGKPYGWSYDRLGNITVLSWGDTNTTKSSYVKSGYPAYSASGPDGFMSHADFDRKGVVLSAIGANCGQTWFASGKWSCIKNTIRIWSNNQYMSDEYLYLATHGSDFWPKRGSAQPFISQTDARNCVVLNPSKEIGILFGNITAPIYEKIRENKKENTALSETRDLLLPKLMSGEIRLYNAGSAAEAVLAKAS